LDFAESDINRPHIFVANMIYNLPGFNGSNGFVKTVLGGWEVATIVQLSSGTSLTPQINATGLRDLPARVRDSRQASPEREQASLTSDRCGSRACRVRLMVGRTRFINPDAFTLVGYRIGQTIPKRTTCLGPPTKNVDFSVYKNFTPSWLKNSFLGEQARVQFRLEFFNAFNTPQFRGDGPNFPMTFYRGKRCLRKRALQRDQ
jgi:hypothetical protein